MDHEIQFAAEFLQESDVSASSVAKSKIRTDAYALNAAKVARELANENLSGLLAERAVESKQQQCVATEGFDGAEFLGQRIYQRGHAIGRNDRVGVLIERQDAGMSVVQPMARQTFLLPG
jgi:hypothetical protein